MQEWFRDSDWVDEPPSITVTMGSGAVCQLDCTATVALPPDAVFNVVRDPHNRRVFKNVKSVSDVRVVSDDGGVQHVEMNMTFLWRLPAISGTFTAHVLMIQDRPNRMLSYELTRPGFMKKFQGFWKVEPLVVPSSPAISGAYESDDRGSQAPGRASQAVACLGSALDSDDANIVMSGVVTAAAAAGGRGGGGGTVPPALSPAARRVASRIVLHQIAQPSVAPPPVFRKCLKGILQTSTRDMLRDFQNEAARIRSSRGEERLGETEEGGKGAQVARERAEKRTASFLHKETLRASGLSPGSKVVGSGGFAANLGKKTGMNLVKGAMSRSKKGLTSLVKAGRK
ncbi:unnamed protein product [Closterium sp. NIES-64]|nr:unnamed protein product [Closterium sp. NIES-64]